MRMTRLTFFAVVLMAALGALHAFPSEPADRAALVCRPILFLTDVATQLASSMSDSGRVDRIHAPWHDNAYRGCERIAERIFVAAAES